MIMHQVHVLSYVSFSLMSEIVVCKTCRKDHLLEYLQENTNHLKPLGLHCCIETLKVARHKWVETLHVGCWRLG